MEEVLGFFRTYEVWIYLILGLIGVLFLRKFILSWQDLRAATFGLERESAQGKLNAAASMLVLLLTLALAEFALVSFVAPSIPGATPLNTPTLNLLATPTTTLQTTSTISSTVVIVGETTPTPSLQSESANNCVQGQIFIDSPSDGEQINGIIEIRGTADVPNFGFYKLEMKRTDEQNWLTILAGNQMTQNAVLGSWNTSLLSGGEYQLSLVVIDNQGQTLPACIIKVYIINQAATANP